MIRRRDVLRASMMGGGAAFIPGWASALAQGLPAIGKKAVPITREERIARIGRAQALMKRDGLRAILVEPGSSLDYFTGVQWWRSERMTAALIPVEGDACVFTPFFEEPSVRETLAIPAEVRTWNEDENPQTLAADWLVERKLAAGPVGMEETVRHFIVDGIKNALPDTKIVSGASVVRGCRMHKTAAEIALMQAANDITLAAIRHAGSKTERGMTPHDIGKMVQAASVAMGAEAEIPLVLLGEAAAYPHGSGKPQAVRDGEVVLIDAGCSVHGYASDISRTFVFGEASKRQRDVWAQMRQGQQIAIEAAQIGAEAGSVDDKVRAWYEKIGYGPGYKLPGLSHRTGHGIGMDGHEPVNLVHGEKIRLAPGMCFSNEPGIYIPGSFGIRLEDCFHMTEAGPEFFTQPPASIDAPL